VPLPVPRRASPFRAGVALNVGLGVVALAYGKGRINQIASERPQPHKDTILIGTSEPAVSDDIRYQNGGELSGLARITEAVCDATGPILDAVSAAECANYFATAGLISSRSRRR
jgi:hypothetical protein